MLKNILKRLWMLLLAFVIGWIFREVGAPIWGALLGGFIAFGFESTFWAFRDLDVILLEIRESLRDETFTPIDDD